MLDIHNRTKEANINLRYDGLFNPTLWTFKRQMCGWWLRMDKYYTSENITELLQSRYRQWLILGKK